MQFYIAQRPKVFLNVFISWGVITNPVFQKKYSLLIFVDKFNWYQSLNSLLEYLTAVFPLLNVAAFI